MHTMLGNWVGGMHNSGAWGVSATRGEQYESGCTGQARAVGPHRLWGTHLQAGWMEANVDSRVGWAGSK